MVFFFVPCRSSSDCRPSRARAAESGLVRGSSLQRAPRDTPAARPREGDRTRDEGRVQRDLKAPGGSRERPPSRESDSCPACRSGRACGDLAQEVMGCAPRSPARRQEGTGVRGEWICGVRSGCFASEARRKQAVLTPRCLSRKFPRERRGKLAGSGWFRGGQSAVVRGGIAS